LRDRGNVPEISPKAGGGSRDNLYGGLNGHYYHHLKALAALNRERLAEAKRHLGRSLRALEENGHAGRRDSIRDGYTTLCRGRVLCQQGLFPGGSVATVEQGLALLNEARWLFRDRGFAPGEYLAYNDYLETRMALDAQTESRLDRLFWVPLLKEAKRLAQRSGVPAFRLESILRYADALRETGRLNAARMALDELRFIGQDGFERELRTSRLKELADGLIEATKHAQSNAVDPLQPWGLSSWAINEELDFVKRARVNADAGPISVYAPPGCGRRILIGRIIEARGHISATHEIDGTVMTDTETLAEVETLLAANDNVILYDLDQWSRALQASIVRLLNKHPEWRRRAYATLTAPAAGLERTTPGLGAMLEDWTFEIKPLSARPNDKLMLARGFLIRAMKRAPRKTTDNRIKNPEMVVFTGQFCHQLRQREIGIGELNTAMRLLAQRLRPARDVIFVANGIVKVTAEALERHLWAQSARSTTPSTPAAPRGGTPTRGTVGIEIVEADEARVAQLATQYPSFAAVARAAGIKRTTLMAIWKRRKVWPAWERARR
jgi:hypothetical protein